VTLSPDARTRVRHAVTFAAVRPPTIAAARVGCPYFDTLAAMVVQARPWSSASWWE